MRAILPRAARATRNRESAGLQKGRWSGASGRQHVHEHLLLPGSTLIQVDRKAEPLPLGWRIPIALIRLGSGLRIPMIWIDPSIAQPPSRNEG
jgi:hypothetical protein